MNDITGDYRHIIERLKANGDFYKIAADFTYDWEMWVTPNDEIIFCSFACEDITGYPPQNFIDDPEFIFSIVHPDDLEGFRKHWGGDISKGNKPHRFRIIARETTIKWIEQRSNFVYSPDGYYLGRRLSNRDITEIIKTNKELLIEKTSLFRQVHAKTHELSMLSEILRDVEKTYQAFFDNANDAIFIADIDTGLISDANKAAEMLIGRKKEEIIGMHQSMLHPPDKRQYYEELFREAIRSASIKHEEVEVIDSKGNISIVSISASLIKIKGKTYLQGIFHDITEMKKAEEELRKGRELFELAIKGSRDGIWDWDIRNNKLYLSPMWKRMLGYEDSDLENKIETFFDNLHPDDLERVTNFINDYLKGTESEYRNEFRMRHKDGHYVWILAKGEALRDSSGCPYRMAGSHIDITHLKNVEQALKESEERLRIMTDNMRDVFWLRSADNTKILYISPAYEKIWGRPCSELYEDPNSFLKAVHKDDIDMLLRHFDHYNKNNADSDIEYRITRPDGEIRWIWAKAFAIRDVSGKIIYHSGTAVDITDRKRMEMQLAIAKEAAEHANKAKSEFLANMSHEIRTPMNAIIGMSDILISMDLTDEQRHYCNIISSSANSLLNIINDILDFSKIEAGRIDIEEESFSLRVLFSELVDMFTPQASLKDLSISYHIDDDLPDTYLGDRGRLRQILVNLIGNAIKFTHKGGVSISAQMISRYENYVSFSMSIKDTGIGIPKEKMHMLFNAFSQLDNSTTKQYGGTGLGLAISQRLANLMGGRISVESTYGEGSKFTLTITLKTTQEDERSQLQKVPSVVKAEPINTSQKILVVEDNPMNQMVVKMMLERMGLCVDVVENGFDALKALRNEDYLLVLMDCHMPLMDGFETTNLIRSGTEGVRDPNVPIIALTALATKEDFERCKMAGMNHFLSKPVSFDKLRDAVIRFRTSK
ncbi:MAG: PAS domain-containing protein [Thermodesulfovibrionales bacterium]